MHGQLGALGYAPPSLVVPSLDKCTLLGEIHGVVPVKNVVPDIVALLVLPARNDDKNKGEGDYHIIRSEPRQERESGRPRLEDEMGA